MFRTQNKKIFLFTILFAVVFFAIQRKQTVKAEAGESLGHKLSGKILIQVEQNGEAWYVNPNDSQRYFLGRPMDAFTIMRKLGLGISETDYARFHNQAPQKLAGKILLRVQYKGQAYYVNPIDLKMYYLGRPKDAFGVMRDLGLGITNENLKKIPISENSQLMSDISSPESVQTPTPPVIDTPESECQINIDCDDGNPYTTDTCIEATYSIKYCNSLTTKRTYRYYNFCWDYDCTLKKPYPKLEKSIKPKGPMALGSKPKAIGDVSIIVVFLYKDKPLPQEQRDILTAELTGNLITPDRQGQDRASLRYVEKWYEEQAKSYGIHLDINMEFTNQQYQIDDYTKARRKNFPQYAKYDVVAFFYYFSEYHKPIRDMAYNHALIQFSVRDGRDPNEPEKYIFGPNYSNGRYVGNFAHELSHVFGARDKYNPWKSKALRDTGIGCSIITDDPVELGKDITCLVKIIHRDDDPYPDLDEIWSYVSMYRLNELNIHPITAKELGWLDVDGDGVAEIKDPCPDMKDNSCGHYSKYY